MNSSEQIQEHVERILERGRARERRRRELRSELAVAPAIAERAELVTAAASSVLFAEGDSWFDYPGTDVLEELEDIYGYEISTVAHRGDTLESMAYSEKQLDGLERRLRKLAEQGRAPRAILLSGGGNDIAGPELGVLLNHSRSGLDPLNDDIVRGFIEGRLNSAYATLIRTISGLCERHFDNSRIPVVVHGYDYGIPDGRGFLGGWGPLPGPWLRPAFQRKGYGDLASNARTIRRLINRFNEMLAELSGQDGLEHVHYVNLRGTLVSDLTDDRYKESWDNELHPEDPGFVAVAGKIHDALSAL